MWLIAINPWTFFLPDFVHEHLQLLVYGDGASTFQALPCEGKFGAHIHVDDFFGVQLIFVLYSESKKYINFHTSTKIILDYSFKPVLRICIFYYADPGSKKCLSGSGVVSTK